MTINSLNIIPTREEILASRLRMMQSKTECPVGMLLGSGRCSYSGEICRYLNNTVANVGLEKCMAVKVLHNIADGEIQLGD
jgi:hypothetical protein